jgi:integrase
VLSPEVATMVDRWHSAMVPPEAARFAREAVSAAAPASAPRAKALLFAASRAAAFALSVGLELRPQVVFCPSVVERFVLAGAADLSGPTRRTLRTNLRALGRALEAFPAPLPVALPRERAKKPYTTKEISAYLALADAQPTTSRAMRAGGLICLGAGAGLTGSDLSGVRGTDITARHGGVVAQVHGRRARSVPVLARFHARLLAVSTFAGDGFVVGGTASSRRNVVPGLVASVSGGTDMARLEVARLRSTWLAEVAALVGLGAFMGAAGVDVSQRLGDIAAGLGEVPEEEVVALLGGRSC